jgi:hypothetical protein
MRTTVNPIAAWQGGIHYLAEAAAAPDGRIWMRTQERDPRYGYRWGKWRAVSKADPAELPETIPCGFSDLRRINNGPYRPKWEKWRLPA